LHKGLAGLLQACTSGAPGHPREASFALMASRVATAQFEAVKDGETIIVLAGARFAASDPVVKDNPGMFRPEQRRRIRKKA
jgi:hypothetical protein